MEIIQDSNYLNNYNGFIIKDSKTIKKSIDDLYKKINIIFNLFINCDITKSTIKENIIILEYLLSNKKKLKLHVKDIIYIFEQIIRTYLEDCAQEERVQYKASINSELCEFLIQYSFLFEHSLFRNKLDSIKNYFINRCMQLSIKEGCVLCWLTFATLCPQMININCYLQINMSGVIYKYTNWKYIKENSLLKNKLELYFQYYPNYPTYNDNIDNIKISYI
jgi:hypothetical protein